MVTYFEKLELFITLNLSEEINCKDGTKNQETNRRFEAISSGLPIKETWWLQALLINY